MTEVAQKMKIKINNRHKMKILKTLYSRKICSVCILSLCRCVYSTQFSNQIAAKKGKKKE